MSFEIKRYFICQRLFKDRIYFTYTFFIRIIQRQLTYQFSVCYKKIGYFEALKMIVFMTGFDVLCEPAEPVLCPATLYSEHLNTGVVWIFEWSENQTPYELVLGLRFTKLFYTFLLWQSFNLKCDKVFGGSHLC
jgi:hypothetical protein